MNTTGTVGWRSWYTDYHSNICNYLVSFRRSLLCALQRTDLGVFLIVSFFNVLICPERSVALAWWPSPRVPKHQLPWWEGQMGWFLRCSAACSLKDGGSQVFSLTQTLEAWQQEGRMCWSRSWELMSDPQANAEREIDWGMARLLKFQSTTPVPHHLSEGHTSGSYPNSSANWGSSIKIYKPLGDWEYSYSKPYQGPHSHCFSLFSVKAKDFLSLKTVS